MSILNRLSKMSIKEKRAEYTRLRDIARKRINRLKTSRFKDYEVADYYFPKIREMDINDIDYYLAEIDHYVNKQVTTLKGLTLYEQKMTEALQKNGYSIEADELKSFGDFMEEARSINKGRLSSSDIIYEIYKHSQRLGMDPRTLKNNFKEYLRNGERVEELYNVLSNTNKSDINTKSRRLTVNALKSLLQHK